MTSRTASTLCLAALLALAGTPALAQHGPAAPAKAAPAPAASASAVDPATGEMVETAAPTKDAKIEHLVVEDSQVKIEETRVRGVTKKIVVHSKIPGMGSYEIQPKDPSVAPENDHGAGMRTFTFPF
jgi:hypothetical protein